VTDGDIRHVPRVCRAYTSVCEGENQLARRNNLNDSGPSPSQDRLRRRVGAIAVNGVKCSSEANVLKLERCSGGTGRHSGRQAHLPLEQARQYAGVASSSRPVRTHPSAPRRYQAMGQVIASIRNTKGVRVRTFLVILCRGRGSCGGRAGGNSGFTANRHCACTVQRPAARRRRCPPT
jgi:hypothetical protein